MRCAMMQHALTELVRCQRHRRRLLDHSFTPVSLVSSSQKLARAQHRKSNRHKLLFSHFVVISFFLAYRIEQDGASERATCENTRVSGCEHELLALVVRLTRSPVSNLRKLG
jgi:hypothetical protein